MIGCLVFGYIFVLTQGAFGLVLMTHSGDPLRSAKEGSSRVEVEDVASDRSVIMPRRSQQLTEFPLENKTVNPLEWLNKTVNPLEWLNKTVNPLEWLNKTVNPLEWLNKTVNPLEWLNKTVNPLEWLNKTVNPLEWLNKTVNPLEWLNKTVNPLEWLNKTVNPLEWLNKTVNPLEWLNKTVNPLEWSSKIPVSMARSVKTADPLKWGTNFLDKEDLSHNAQHSEFVVYKNMKIQFNIPKNLNCSHNVLVSQVPETGSVKLFQRRRRSSWERKVKSNFMGLKNYSPCRHRRVPNVLFGEKSRDSRVKFGHSENLCMFVLCLRRGYLHDHSNLEYGSPELMSSLLSLTLSSLSSSPPPPSSSLSSSQPPSASSSSSSSLSLSLSSSSSLEQLIQDSTEASSEVNVTEEPYQPQDNKIVAQETCQNHSLRRHKERLSSYTLSFPSLFEPKRISAAKLKLRRKRSTNHVQRVRLAQVSLNQAQLDSWWRMRRLEAKVGVLVVVDYSIYRKYLQGGGNDPKTAMSRIGQYYSMVVSMIDQRFGTINEPHLQISVRMSGLVVCETRQDCIWLESIVDWTTLRNHGRGSVFAEHALQKLTTWISGRSGLPEFDHAMLFTGYRLTNSEDVSLGGMAYLKAICDVPSGKAISIVFDIGDFQCIKVATHELAHSLGAYHDGDQHQQHCRPDSNYIMSPLNTYSHREMKNAFYFSACSIQDMWQHLSSTTSSCVKNDPPVYQLYDVARTPPGKLYNADMQCKLAFGARSRLCQDDKVASIMCGQLWCSDPDKPTGCRTNTYMTALPGTPCGQSMLCHLGECIHDNSQNNAHRPLSSYIKVISSIPRHVQKSVQEVEVKRQDPMILSLTARSTRRTRKRKNRCTQDKNSRYCDGLTRLNPSGCKRRSIRRYCCMTCRRPRRKIRKHNP